MDSREFDIVVFGATGITGKYVFEELARVAKQENIKYALAARSENKLKATIEESKKYIQSEGETIDDVPIIIADINDENSIIEMCKRTKVILNCAGPYIFHGEIVIKSCIAAGTHHIDVSAESIYLEEMQLKYHEEAIQKGIYVLGACGFSSIPSEMGLSLIKKKFQGDLNSVETYLQFHENPQGKIVNAGILKSMIYNFLNRNKIGDIRKRLNDKIFKKFPNYSHLLKKRPIAFKSEVTNRWCLPYPACDKTVAIRSQLFNYNYKNERAVQINTYFMSTLFNFFLTIIMAFIFFVFLNFKLGRQLLKSINLHESTDITQKFKESAPTEANIRLSVTKFERMGNVHDVQRSERPTIPDKTIQRAETAITESTSSFRIMNCATIAPPSMREPSLQTCNVSGCYISWKKERGLCHLPRYVSRSLKDYGTRGSDGQRVSHDLQKYPKVFTLGLFQEGGPTRQQLKESTFNIVYWADGWNDKLEIDQKHTEPPNKFMKVVLNAPNAALLTTSLCMVQAGIVCLKETENMPGSGGVLTPGAAFENTSLLERLQKFGMEFSIMEK
ncbi:saccharopine dehydrogenase-like oxidoreductase [Centruroides vittatus]|uniref:saccharopine dehydrogenase-like oxidoreductase n=1 Tax=Centruroides vittatus TaxID=120091 RepID=UPI00350ED4A9